MLKVQMPTKRQTKKPKGELPDGEVVTMATMLENLEQKGNLMPMVKAGVISISMYNWLEIYRSFIALRKVGMAKMEAYYEVSFNHNLTVNHVVHVIKKMDRPVFI